jgi:threonine synthase
VRGLISDAGRMVSELIAHGGWFDVSTLKEPYRIEGKKTIALEIAEQLAWKLPDVIVCPTGGGPRSSASGRASGNCSTSGGLRDRCRDSWRCSRQDAHPSLRRTTPALPTRHLGARPAFGINVPKPLGDFLVLEAIRQSGGSAVAVSDTDLLDEQARIMQGEGIFVCPEGAAAVAAVRSLRDSGWLTGDEHVVALNTGSGLVYPEAVPVRAPLLAVGEPLTAYLDREDRERR